MNSLRLWRPCLSLRRPFSTCPTVFSGHNKWSKIKEKKGANDMKKGAVYARANKDILIAVRHGGSADPETNATLAAVIKRVKSQGVPKDNIESALKRASGEKAKGDQHVTYEAMAPGNVGVMIECLTDNVNRTIKLLRSVLSNHDTRFADVKYLFERKGSATVLVDQGEDVDERIERLIETALEAGAEDFDQTSPSEDAVEIEFICPPADLTKVTAAITAPGMSRELVNSELIYVPAEPSEGLDEETETRIAELLDAIEENEDTLRVWTTIDR